MKTVEDLIEDGYETVRADVSAAVKAHPQYVQFVDSLVTRVLTELFKMAA